MISVFADLSFLAIPFLIKKLTIFGGCVFFIILGEIKNG
jgi:hypothetical protein